MNFALAVHVRVDFPSRTRTLTVDYAKILLGYKKFGSFIDYSNPPLESFARAINFIFH